ncbi:MAG: GspH/FimT family pseudopilin [Tepidisphaeraceae bacterium]
MRNRAGFTLVELLIVVVIIGIMAAAVVPTVSADADLKLAGATRALMADLAYARLRAIQSQTRQFVQFSTQQYALLHAAGATVVATSHPVNGGDYTLPFGQGVLADVSLDRVNIEGLSTIGFDALGSPASYNPNNQQFTTITTIATIRLQSGGQFMTISIEPYTGEMSVTGG